MVHLQSAFFLFFFFLIQREMIQLIFPLLLLLPSSFVFGVLVHIYFYSYLPPHDILIKTKQKNINFVTITTTTMMKTRDESLIKWLKLNCNWLNKLKRALNLCSHQMHRMYRSAYIFHYVRMYVISVLKRYIRNSKWHPSSLVPLLGLSSCLPLHIFISPTTEQNAKINKFLRFYVNMIIIIYDHWALGDAYKIHRFMLSEDKWMALSSEWNEVSVCVCVFGRKWKVINRIGNY